MGAPLCQDLVWPKKFIRDFLGRLSHTKELGLNIDSTANLDFWSWDLSGIGGDLVSVLGFGNVQLKLLVKLVEVSDENLSMCQCEVIFGVNSDVWVITLVGKEGCNAIGGTQSFV